MRNSSLHAVLRAHAEAVGAALRFETERGAEVPFEVQEAPGGDGPALYCYRPLTGRFIDERRDVLDVLPTRAAALRALERVDGLEAYLRRRDEDPDGVDRPRLALRCLVEAAYDDTTDFTFSEERFARAYNELEAAVYAGTALTTVVVRVLGLELESDAVELGDGLALIRAQALEDAPRRASDGVLARFQRAEGPGESGAVTAARQKLRRLLTALRLYDAEPGALAPLAWARKDEGSWHPVPLAMAGQAGAGILVAAAHEDELRAFCSLLTRRTPASGPVAWALGRYEMGLERRSSLDGLTDHLLALRALLEPEGSERGMLARRLGALCSQPDEREALTERVRQAELLERAVAFGDPAPPVDPEVLSAEIAGHLRALLRDVVCGHLDGSLRLLADELLAESLAMPAEPAPVATV